MLLAYLTGQQDVRRALWSEELAPVTGWVVETFTEIGNKERDFSASNTLCTVKFFDDVRSQLVH